MKCYISRLGIIDHLGKIHDIKLTPGLNIITGKSSTGKSAIIEIFDYCMGSSDFTVPDGVITQQAVTYFVVLEFSHSALVLGRRGGSTKAFLKSIESPTPDSSSLPIEESFFPDDEFVSLPEFKKELGRYFGITLNDVDESLETKERRGGKSPTPSIRSFMSFMLQHQNLVANKHAIFYRFDEKEKRDQTIEHLKIFLGFADQNYFALSQKINKLRIDLRSIEFQIPRQFESKKIMIEKLNSALDEFSSIAGKRLVDAPASTMADYPDRWARLVANAPVEIDGAANEFSAQRDSLDGARSELVSELRVLNRQKSSVQSSIKYADQFNRGINNIQPIKEANIHTLECPFCGTPNSDTEKDANALSNAISWLNSELEFSSYRRETFETDAFVLDGKIDAKRSEIRDIEQKILNLDRQISALKNKRSMVEMAVKAKIRVETTLEDLALKPDVSLLEKKAAIEAEIISIQKEISRYGMEEKLTKAEDAINREMAKLGKNLDFEEGYRPINLNFSLTSFDLCHRTPPPNSRQVFLRSMGSGANWLYCHISLFLSLHHLFCSLDSTCKIPPILFLDQPSQVYFPSFEIDTAEVFNPEDLTIKYGKAKSVDEDLRSVQRMFSQIAQFCESTMKETGIEPQIIVSDHADGLQLECESSFESFVRARWRKRGFIDLA